MPTITTLAKLNFPEQSPLLVDAAGDLFGTTLYGDNGSEVENPDVFEIAQTASGYASTPTTLVNFDGLNVSGDPTGGVVADAAGDLFGTSELAGTDLDGSVFEVAETTSGYTSTATILVNFNGNDGRAPNSPLITDASGDLFGTTNAGGARGSGTVFEIVKTASGYPSTPTILVSLTATEGGYPTGGLTTDAAGDLFFTNEQDEVWEIAKTVNGYATSPIQLVTGNYFYGAPVPSLTCDAAGDLFGVTEAGGYGPTGLDNSGTVFEIVKTATGYASTATILVNFNGTDGDGPDAGLIVDAAGDLFGTTGGGGADGDGTVFEIAKSATGYASTPTVLINFNGTNGSNPESSLTVDSAGDLFGTTQGDGQGTAFEITNSGYQTVASGTGTSTTSSGSGSTTTSGGAATLPGGITTVDAGSGGAFSVPAGASAYVTSEGSDTIYASTGTPTISASTGNPVVFANNASLDFIGGSGAATVIGGSADNTVTGGSGSLVLFAVSPTTFTPGTGASTIIGGNGALTATLGAGGGQVFGGTGGGNVLAVASGSTGNSALVGVGNGDVLTDAGAGSDILVGGAGAETLNAAASTGSLDAFFGGSGAESINGGSGQSYFVAGSGNETLTGGAGLSLFAFISGASARTDVITNFNSGDLIGLFGYGTNAVSNALSTASVTNAGTTLTLSDNTTIVLAGFTNLSINNF